MEQRDMWQEMRRHFSDMADAIDKAVRKVPPFSRLMKAEHPPVNIYGTEEELIVRVEVPGVPKEDLGVSLTERALVIEGKQDRSQYEGCTPVCEECGAAEFSREIALPQAIDEEVEPTASLENGVLTIRLKKRPPEEGKAVHVEVR